MTPDDLKMTRGGVEYNAESIERVRKRKLASDDILSAWEKRLARCKP